MSIGFLILLLALIPALWKRSGVFSLVWILGSGLLGFEYGEVLYSREIQDFILTLPMPLGEVNIGLDKLSAFFGVMFSLGLPIGILYGNFYLKQHKIVGLRSHLFWLGVMGLAMHGILWIRHSLLFLLVWEIMSLSSFFCIIADREHSLKAGLRYLAMMQVGAAFLCVGFALALLENGSFDFGTFSNLSTTAKYLILAGFAVKAGFFPLYSWLPQAHPVAPSHVSGIMSGLVIKSGLYGILVVLCMNSFSLAEILILITISLLSAFLGVVHCLSESNIKRALAYSSIENMGIIGLGLGIGLLGKYSGRPVMMTLGFTGALLHTFFHSLFKPLLFYLSGNVQCACHSLEMDDLGGLHKSMPLTSVLFITAVLAISALPIGNGFISEFTIYFGMLDGLESMRFLPLLISIISLTGMAFIGALALIAFTRMYGIVFLGSPRRCLKGHEADKGMLFPQIVLAGAILLTGISGVVGFRYVKPLMIWMGMSRRSLTALVASYNQMTIVFGIMVLLLVMLYIIRRIYVKDRRSATWGCGYHAAGSRMQYTSMAFPQPLSYFLKPFIKLEKHYDVDDATFVGKISYTQHVRDFLFDYVISPFWRMAKRIFSWFDGIHNGRINSYVTYTLVFLILLIIWVLRVVL